ncbi:MAG: hypothetical protein HUU37_05990 [Bdellovibrionales bacterium]|nr:hypothetical protein [Bdellovibrionales bacterium]
MNLASRTIAALLLSFPVLAPASNEAGFTAGNDFQAVWLDGEISLNCQDSATGRSDFAVLRCEREVLDPAEFTRFKGPQVEADEVVLTATREDGSTREKSGGYDGTEGRSTGSFNLWISTLFQRPLLKMGRNVIAWALSKEGKTVAEGKFDATVTQGPDRQCRYRRTYFSSNINDCATGGSFCDRYFQDENWCL